MQSTRRLPPIWALVSLAWLGPAMLAVFREYLQAAINDSEKPSLAALVWEAGD